ncbi:hypothetical protein KJ596_03650 [Patescibacteria group bacterium]|nr:hypothetical protein [Patescibacteria group bacterium]
MSIENINLKDKGSHNEDKLLTLDGVAESWVRLCMFNLQQRRENSGSNKHKHKEDTHEQRKK